MDNNTPIAFRERIAQIISLSVIISSGALGVIGLVLAGLYIGLADNQVEGLDKAKDILQYIFSSLLPLWGTWIGTVLAYYFAKENFESANKHVSELVNRVTSATDKLNAAAVTKIMMPFDKLKRTEVATAADADSLNLKSLYDSLLQQGIRRALIFSKDRKVIYVIHKSLISDYLLRNQNVTTPLTIGTMKTDSDKDVKNAFANGVATVNKSATLLDVKNLMDNLPGCQDVFVTETGKRDEEVLGWISNVDVMENGKV
jgi:hypothetical protein